MQQMKPPRDQLTFNYVRVKYIEYLSSFFSFFFLNYFLCAMHVHSMLEYFCIVPNLPVCILH